jgi:hypothetical protein
VSSAERLGEKRVCDRDSQSFSLMSVSANIPMPRGEQREYGIFG